MVIENPDARLAALTGAGNGNGAAHPSGIPQDQIDNIMSGIANTGDVKMNNHRKKLRQRFDIIKKLGQGTYGKVQLGINKETGQEVAIKTIKKCKIEAEADLVRIRREVQIMSSVQHPNIIHIYEVFENREKMVLVMEFAAGGELYDYLSERKVLSEEEARRIFRQVSTAVYYCHKHKICHRDLKLENILLDEQGNAKIADFGLSNVFAEQRLLATFCGSPLYASPEIVEGTPYQGPEVDCWSLGVLLYTLVYGSMPFDGSNFKRLVKQISQGDYYEPKKPSRASSLIRDMLTVCPRKRATIEQICSHWWVNENDNLSCLDLAENLANQTPVRLDVLLSLTPAAVTADQLVVPSADGSAPGKTNERVSRSHSVGSIRDVVPNTEAERRIMDMVAAGGEAALMPSPTRTITPAQSPIQTKRKLETTISTENAVGALKKKEKPGSAAALVIEEMKTPPNEETPMDYESAEIPEEPQTATIPKAASKTFSPKDMEAVGNLCEKLIHEDAATAPSSAANNIAVPPVARQKTVGKLDAVQEAPEEKDATKVIKKFVNKHKTADLVNAIGQLTPEKPAEAAPPVTETPAASTVTPFVRKCSLQDETSLNKFSNEQRRKSRILETAEKFAQMNAGNGADKPKKLVIPGVSVGSFKKEFERKATTPAQPQGPTPGELRAQEQVAAAAAAQENEPDTPPSPGTPAMTADSTAIEGSDSKNSVTSLSMDEARRSMENSIALLRQAQHESSKEVDQLCAQTEGIGVSDSQESLAERERKLKNARAIIGNAIQPVIARPPNSSYFGSGGGGYGHLRTNSGDYADFNVNGGGAPYALPHQMTPNQNVAPSSPWYNSATGHLATGGYHSGSANNNSYNSKSSAHRNSLMSPFMQKSLNNFINKASKQQANPMQLQQMPQHQQQQLEKMFRQITMHPPQHSLPPLNKPTATASFAPAAHATIATTNNVPKPFYNAPPSSLCKLSPGGDPNAGQVKTSTASITLKSATLPRRKTAKTEIQLDIKPRTTEPQPQMRFTTEMQRNVPDLRSAPAREGPMPFSPIRTQLNAPRATSLEPKEHIIPIQRPQPPYARTTSNTTTRSGSLSRQSTIDSESDSTTTATNLSQSTIAAGGSSQPIKKSPREFIIPIAVEGGGFITPREGSIEPSESSHTTASSRSTFSRLRPTRRIGSLLSDSGVDEGTPFQKMRTGSLLNKDADDDPHFTLHRLRSSRPMKKISQDNDSQSSGEEDDDDGFEILTAENLFSTLLQRVRALTNRMNVNNDIRSFPNSSSLLNNMRQSPNSIWNREPFGRSQVSYTYSETVEKKVRLNNASSNLGAPWRHSLSRDMGSDMESMFNRAGATLPRGNKIPKTANRLSADVTDSKPTEAAKIAADPLDEEPLDLADLDLSRLRLSKKDLETLSSITPTLPKCFQEQLLAKLPPTQARKLSRTLSMQNRPQPSVYKVYKRSQSDGRGTLPEEPPHIEQTDEPTDNEAQRSANGPVYRRSLSRTRYDCDTCIPTPTEPATTKSRSASVCRDDYSKSLCSSYTSDISDKYKYYSPYLHKPAKDAAARESGSVSPQKRYSSISPRESISGASAAVGRPPSGCLSPPPAVADGGGSNSLRRRSTQRRISRFLRPDFFEEPLPENPYQREKTMRERETQSVLREIREKSRERSRDRATQSSYDCAELFRRKPSLGNEAEEPSTSDHNALPLRKKSMEEYSMSTPRSSRSNEQDEHVLADKILQELQILSAARLQQEQRRSVPRELSVERTAEALTHVINDVIKEQMSTRKSEETEEKEKTSTIKKVKKLKPKENAGESSTTDGEHKISTTVVRKVKKVVKKTETIKTPEIGANDEATLQRESKLKRPNSYPMKELPPPKSEVANGLSTTKLPVKTPPIPESSTELSNSNLSTSTTSSNSAAPRESRLIRPKSYPATKLTPPKDMKKIVHSGCAIPSIAEDTTQTPYDEAKSQSVTPTGKSSADNSSSSESRPTTIKKITKVTKKSKLVPPTTVTTPVLTPSATAEEPNLATIPPTKEKSPEKKPGKGLLYAIGQKFEKYREKKMSGSSSNSGTTKTLPKKSNDDISPEKVKEKSTLLKKKKSLENGTIKTEKIPGDTVTATAGSDTEKPAKGEKRSRIDAMIRSLRERSVPRSPAAIPNESNYIKRAVSVEEMPGTFNRNAVNKVLGLFKRFEKDGDNERRVQSTRSTSNIERQLRESAVSPIYQNSAVYEAQGNHISKANGNKVELCSCDISMATPKPKTKLQNTACVECMQNEVASVVTKRRDDTVKYNDDASKQPYNAQSNKEKRKGLMLDLVKLEKLDNSTTCSRGAKSAYVNGNGIYSNLPPYPGSSNTSSSQQSVVDNATNNNNSSLTNNNNSQTSGYHTVSAHEINRNSLLTPSSDNIANYSSDSRSYHDDCASTSTFLSPTDEPELYFDNWSICSEDNYMLHATPSPTVSRLSRASQLSSPTRCESSDPNESVIDRIKRRSFYCRFNDKKPKRTSSIVGPSAVRDYYREQQAAVKARSNTKLNATSTTERRTSSPDITHEFFRPLKLSAAGTELKKPPAYKPTHDYGASLVSGKPRKSLNDIRPTPSSSYLSLKRYGTKTDNDYLTAVPPRYKPPISSSAYESNGPTASTSSYYSTYNPKRRSSYNALNGTLPSGSGLKSTTSHIDGYATVGRRPIRPYDQRTVSLLDPTTSGIASYRRETRTPVRDYTSTLSRSNSRYRTSSATRSPTNI